MCKRRHDFTQKLEPFALEVWRLGTTSKSSHFLNRHNSGDLRGKPKLSTGCNCTLTNVPCYCESLTRRSLRESNDAQTPMPVAARALDITKRFRIAGFNAQATGLTFNGRDQWRCPDRQHRREKKFMLNLRNTPTSFRQLVMRFMKSPCCSLTSCVCVLKIDTAEVPHSHCCALPTLNYGPVFPDLPVGIKRDKGTAIKGRAMDRSSPCIPLTIAGRHAPPTV